MTASKSEIDSAVVAIKSAAAGIIHAAIMQQVPFMYAAQAEQLVNDIEVQVFPVAAKVAIETTDASRSDAVPKVKLSVVPTSSKAVS